MTEAEALAMIQGMCAAGRWRLSAHARQRMQERGARDFDVLRAVATASRARSQPDARWRLDGVDRSGDDLTVIVVVEGLVAVVTVY